MSRIDSSKHPPISGNAASVANHTSPKPHIVAQTFSVQCAAMPAHHMVGGQVARSYPVLVDNDPRSTRGFWCPVVWYSDRPPLKHQGPSSPGERTEVGTHPPAVAMRARYLTPLASLTKSRCKHERRAATIWSRRGQTCCRPQSNYCSLCPLTSRLTVGRLLHNTCHATVSSTPAGCHIGRDSTQHPGKTRKAREGPARGPHAPASMDVLLMARVTPISWSSWLLFPVYRPC